MVANVDPLDNVELGSSADKHAVPQNDARPRTIRRRKLKVDVVLKLTVAPDRYLMGPCDGELRHFRIRPETGALKLPNELSQG